MSILTDSPGPFRSRGDSRSPLVVVAEIDSRDPLYAEKQLASAVLERAVHDVRRRRVFDKHAERLKLERIRGWLCEDENVPFSARWLCSLVNLPFREFVGYLSESAKFDMEEAFLMNL